MNMALAEWCFALNYCNSIAVWDYTFFPREYLYQKLENLFNKYDFIIIDQRLFQIHWQSLKFYRVLVQKCYVEVSEKGEKTRSYLKPTEMLLIIESYMKCLLSIENHGKFYIFFFALIKTRIIGIQFEFKCTLISPKRSTTFWPNTTNWPIRLETPHSQDIIAICNLYCLFSNKSLRFVWTIDSSRYIERILKNTDRCHYVYSPPQKCFINMTKDQSIDPSPEAYVNYIGLLDFTWFFHISLNY